MSKVTVAGYARVSTLEQSLNPQLDELKKAGCTRLYKDVASGAKEYRPDLAKALRRLVKICQNS